MRYKNNFKINKKISLSYKSKTFIIAEAGISHFGSLSKAKKLVDIAKTSGADAVKFQSYVTEDLIDKSFSEWFNRYKIKEVNFDFLLKIKKYCDKKKILFLCTPHTVSTISWIKKFNLPLIKVGSGELGNFPFLKKLIKLNTPLIVSTGMSKLQDLKNLNLFFKKENFDKVIFLKCTSVYPAVENDIKLKNLETFKRIFKNALIGYSDHTKDDLACLTAIGCGYKIIEKHISIDFNVKNAQDWKVSLNKNELKKMIIKIRRQEKILGDEFIKISQEEEKSKIWATKSLYYRKNLPKRKILSEDDFIFLRPGKGISPNELKYFLRKKIKKNVKKGLAFKKDV